MSGHCSITITTASTSSYLDTVDTTVTVNLSDRITTYEITLGRNSVAQKTFSTSQQVRLTNDVNIINMSAIGGGYAGSRGTTTTSGSGGNSGLVVNIAGHSYNGEYLNITVGAADGGISTINNLISAGVYAGSGGTGILEANYAYPHAGKAVNTEFLYPPTQVGGGGGCGAIGNNSAGGGGQYGGGAGGSYSASKNGYAGTKPGAGGGGGGFQGGSSTNGGAGVAGLVGITWGYGA